MVGIADGREATLREPAIHKNSPVFLIGMDIAYQGFAYIRTTH